MDRAARRNLIPEIVWNDSPEVAEGIVETADRLTVYVVAMLDAMDQSPDLEQMVAAITLIVQGHEASHLIDEREAEAVRLAWTFDTSVWALDSGREAALAKLEERDWSPEVWSAFKRVEPLIQPLGQPQ